MVKQITLLIFIITISFNCLGQTKTNPDEKQKNSNTFDSSIVAIIPFDTTYTWIFQDSKPSELTNNDLLNIETLLNKCINDYNSDGEKKIKDLKAKNPELELNKNDFTIDLKFYKRQYVAVINSKAEKEVWVNCFCSEANSIWRKELLVVDDGGNCFFSIKINLTTGTYYELFVNGGA